MKKSKKIILTNYSSKISLFSKVIVIILVIGMVFGNLNLGLLGKFIVPKAYTVINDDIEKDLSEFNKIEEIFSLRTPNSKTYLKENGMYETEYYGEKIHYKNNDEWKEIDNSLSLRDNNRYHNKSNKYNISFPNKLNKDNRVILNYLNNEIKIYYDTKKDNYAKLDDNIDRTQKNLNDGIEYNLDSNVVIEYIVKQDSIKENIILSSYVENYNFSYYIDTNLRIERIGNEIYFYDGQTEVFVMNEYYMYDANSTLIGKHNINGDNNYTYTDLNPDEDIEDNKLTNESISEKFAIDYGYTNDSYKQLEVINYYITTLPIERKYTYETTVNPNDDNTYYTGRIKELEYINGNNQIIKYVYEYDDYSNIKKIYGYTNGVQVYYEENYYDIFNQLASQWIYIEDDLYRCEFGYDARGNIIGYFYESPNDMLSGQFMYDNKDQLTNVILNDSSYDISYSSTGQPNIYLGWEIDYDMRNICVIENEDYFIEYLYNASGIRVGKSIDNGNIVEAVNYILDGSNIIRETHTGADNYTIEYYYDSSDNIIGFTYNSNKYLYLKNLQNDIIGIVDSNNNIVVKYYYDAYGRIIKTNDTSGINLSSINPFRYRSYYQDNETGWYYLNSRYYNPLTNRFITMDQIEYLGASDTILGYNLYLYCENNPINYIDPQGNLAFPGQIHNLVVDELADLYKLYKNVCLINGGKRLFCDLISLNGEIYEVKRNTVKYSKAFKQINKYVHSEIAPTKRNQKLLFNSRDLKFGSAIESGSFYETIGSDEYKITYDYAGQGIVYYDYSKYRREYSYSRSYSVSHDGASAVMVSLLLTGASIAIVSRRFAY